MYRKILAWLLLIIIDSSCLQPPTPAWVHCSRGRVPACTPEVCASYPDDDRPSHCMTDAGPELDIAEPDVAELDVAGPTCVGCIVSFECTPEGWCLNSTGTESYVPAGRFSMGCPPIDSDCPEREKPQHPVDVAGFAIDRTEVTAGAYAMCATCEESSKPLAGLDYPVAFVDWSQAQAFCAWRAAESGLPWRLCTEAQWEKAARGGCALFCAEDDEACCSKTAISYPWGDVHPTCANPALAVFYEENGEGEPGCGMSATWPAGSKPGGASPYGVLDMAGNVWEWVEDCWHNTHDGAPSDGSAWNTSCTDFGGIIGTRRGGSFTERAPFIRAASRFPDGVARQAADIGFRCCRRVE